MRVAFVTRQRLCAGIQRLVDLGLGFAVVVGDAVGSGKRGHGEEGECGMESFSHKMEGRCLCKRVARVKEKMQIACDSKRLPPRLADVRIGCRSVGS